MKYDIKNLTLDEKLELLRGKDTWRLESANGKLKEIFLSDGPCGLRKIRKTDDWAGKSQTIPATAMPTLSTVANTWNVEMARLDGSTIADDCIENDADVLLAPGVNIKRTPLNGRNFEYFSEDPYLSGEMGKAFIEGVQQKGIGTSLKHYLANNRECDRCYQTSEVDERTLREIYIRPFEIALEAKPWTVMSAYNPVNGVYASENKYFLKDVLRDELGFDGLIMSDWGARLNASRALKATLDLRMPYEDGYVEKLKDAYEKGQITDEEIDFCVNNILNLIEKTQNDNKKVTFTKEERHQNAVKIAEEGIVLLKNEDNILPIKSGTVAVGGNQGVTPRLGGGGSALVVTDYKQKYITEHLNEIGGAKYTWPISHIISNESIMQKTDFFKCAYEKDKVVLCISGEYEGEGHDRTTIKLSPYLEQVILETAEINPNLIVCVYSGSAVDMSAWIDKVKAVVWVGYSGEGVNEALANIITGKVCPSGKLAETIPTNIENTYCGNESGRKNVELYSDGVFVGYRFYEAYSVPVEFAFGHGLSYADFTYSNLKIEKHSETDYTVSYDITNNSDFDAKEVSEIYVKDVISMVARPEKELKAFSKDLIPAKSTVTVSVKLDNRAFAYYNTCKKDWHVENGWFEILVGASSSDIRLKEKIHIKLPFETQFSSSLTEEND